MTRLNKWHRVRFYMAVDDPRPVAWPPPGPWWISGYRLSDDAAVCIAWIRKKSELKKFWPEAEVDEWYEPGPIEFSERFPKPDWYKEVKR